MRNFFLIFVYLFFIPLLFIDFSARIYQAIYFRIHDIPPVRKKDFFNEYKKTSNKSRSGINYQIFTYFLITTKWIKSVAAQTEIFSCAIKHWHPASNQTHQKNFYSARLFDNDPNNDPGSVKGDDIVDDSTFFVIQNDKKMRYRSALLEIIAAFSIFSMIIPILLCDLGLILIQNTYFAAAGLKSEASRKKYMVIDRWKLPKLKFAHRVSCLYCEYANGLAAWSERMMEILVEDLSNTDLNMYSVNR